MMIIITLTPESYGEGERGVKERKHVKHFSWGFPIISVLILAFVIKRMETSFLGLLIGKKKVYFLR